MSNRDMTQEDLADQIDRGQSWVNHKLSGRRKANVEDLLLIAEALNIPPAELFENVSNTDQLRKNFLNPSLGEPDAAYPLHSLETIEKKLADLPNPTAQQFVVQIEAFLDLLIANNRQDDDH